MATQKRGNSEGSIYRRGDGRWCAAVSFTDGSRQICYGKTRSEAFRKLQELLNARNNGLVPSSGSRQPLGVFMDTWLETIKPKLAPKTYRYYSLCVRRYIKPVLGQVSLVRLTADAVQRMLNDLRTKGAKQPGELPEKSRRGNPKNGPLSAQSVTHVRNVLRQALGLAVKYDLVSRNVVLATEPPRMMRSSINPFMPEEARQFLSAVNGDPLEALYILGLTTGLRQGELLALKWEDLDFNRAELRVRGSLQRVDGKLQVVLPKTPKSRRTVGLTSLAIEAMSRHRQRQNELRNLNFSRWQEKGFIFTTGIGTPIEPRAVYGAFRRVLDKAGLERRRFHDLRHSAATLLLFQGVSPRVVMEMLGHSQISLTMNTYSHVIPAMQQDAAQRLDAVLRG